MVLLDRSISMLDLKLYLVHLSEGLYSSPFSALNTPFSLYMDPAT